MTIVFSAWSIFSIVMFMVLTLLVLFLFVSEQRMPNWLRLTLTVSTSYFCGSTFAAIWM